MACAERRSALRDAVGEALGDAGDLDAELLQRLGLDRVGAREAVLHRAGDARDLGAHVLGGVGRVVLDGGDAAAERLGDVQHLAAHPLQRAGGALLGGPHVLAHLGQRLLDAVETGVGGGGKLTGQRLAGRLDPGGQLGGCAGDAVLGAALGQVQPLVERLAGQPQLAHGAAAGLVGGVEPLHACLQVADRLERATVAVVDGGGDLADRALERLQRLGRARPGGLVLDLLQPLGERLRLAPGGLQLTLESRGDLPLLALGGVDALERLAADAGGLDVAQALGQTPRLAARRLQLAVETGGHLHLLALGRVDAADHFAHRALDAGDRQRLAILGAFDAVGEALERLGDAADLVGRMADGLVARLSRRGARRLVVARRALREIVLRGGVLRPFGHQARHPFVKGKARATGKVFRHLAARRVDVSRALRDPSGHPNRSPHTEFER